MEKKHCIITEQKPRERRGETEIERESGRERKRETETEREWKRRKEREGGRRKIEREDTFVEFY